MKTEQVPQVLRLRKSHEPDPEAPPDIEIGNRLEQAQSLPAAFVASIVAVVVFSVLWAMFSLLINKFFPWFTMLMGVFIGLAVRRAGLGLDWRFPVLAAAMALVGSIVGNLIVAAAFTASEMQSSTLTVLADIAQLDWATFFDEVLTPADAIFAAFASAIAAFYSMRRLTRRQYLALRLWRQSKD
ncbi:MAG: hypothetical protein QNJ19_03235 [Woeseiaceae bacterium]|nr:hypothetical protein [Woeseiaceae bacterium]